jgi:membrane protease YdiL (CAAX protease family)
VPTLELAFRASDAPGWPAWLFAGLIVLLVPAALASRRAIERGEELPAPGALYLQLSVTLLILGGVALLAARDLGLDVLSRPPPSARAWALGGATLAGMLAAAVLVWRVTPREESERTDALLPRDGRARSLALLTACLAALAEELAFRAVLPALLWHWTGDAWLAVGLAAAIFGITHAVQGRLATAVVFAGALAFQALVEAGGGLAVAVAVHATYDALALLALAPYLRSRAGTSP